MTHDHTPGPDTAPEPTETLQQQVVQSLMGVIGAPDDPGAARTADEALRALDARLAAEAATA